MRITKPEQVQGQALPHFYYGYAYCDFSSGTYYYYPIPVNYIVRFYILLKYRWDVFRGTPSRLDREIKAGVMRHIREFDNL